MNTLAALLWKDLVSEWRSRDRVVAMSLFAFLVVVVLRFALPGTNPDEVRRLAPGLLWVAYVFAALLGLNRAFALELENDALAGLALAPADRGFVFLGKAAANFLLLAPVQAATVTVFGLAFALDLWPVAGRLAGVVALGSCRS
jgi:heme exporter protein B